MYPKLVIDLKKLRGNAKKLVKICGENGVSVAAVTKVFCAERKIVNTISDEGVGFLADSRLENIKSYPNNGIRRMLLRLPSPNEAADVVKSCDLSLNSEIHTLNALADAAANAGLCHGVILMIDLGDLREGVYHKNDDLLLKTADVIFKNKSLNFEGIGVNLTCYGSVLPTKENAQRLLEIANNLRQKLGISLPIISGGNSSSLNLLASGEMPPGITNLRLGESIVRGLETANGERFQDLETDAITLEAEIIELMEKPSYPEGEIGINAFGEKMHYDDIGKRRRAILAVGRQDVYYDGLECLTHGSFIIGASSDHLLVDVTDTNENLKVGDTLTFSLSYGAILAAFTSKYVRREFV